MFKVYSKGCEYALRTLAQMPFNKCQEAFVAKELCRKAKVPESSTRKALQQLVREGVLKAASGPGGGYQLTKDSRKVSLLSIVLAIDGKKTFDKCVMGLSACSDGKPCPIHLAWKRIKKELVKEMGRKTLAQLIQVAKVES